MDQGTVSTVHVPGGSHRTGFAGQDLGEQNTVVISKIPSSARALVYNLVQLDGDAESLQWATVAIVYKALLAKLPDPQQRQDLLDELILQVEEAEVHPAMLLAFVRYDPHHRVVRPAVLAYLRYRRASFDEPFVATAELLGLLHDREVENRGAALAGLVLSGDRRVCAVARTIRDTFSAAEAKQLAEAVAAPVSPASIEFCLNWVLDAVAGQHTEIAEEVAEALEAMLLLASAEPIRDSLYQFGPYGFRNGATLPSVSYSEVRRELLGLLYASRTPDHPLVARLASVFANPAYAWARRVQFEAEQQERRIRHDRRVINLVPHIERRRHERRLDEERRARSDRRERMERRDGDRRVVSLAPAVERRSENRRHNGDRRAVARR